MASKLIRALISGALCVSGIVFLSASPAIAAAGSITGTITRGGGGAFAGGRAFATLLDGSISVQATADGAGVYAVSVDPGVYCVSFGALSYDVTTTSFNDVRHCLDGATSVTVTSGGMVTNINGVVHLGTATGKVVNGGGTAVVGADVSIEQVGGSGAGRMSTNAAGTYAIPNLQLGSYCITANGPNGEQQTSGLPACPYGGRRVDVAADATTSVANIVITAAATGASGGVSGKVTAATGGAPLINRMVTARALTNGYGSGTATTAADGTYSISGLEPGNYCVRVEIDPSVALGAEAFANKDSCSAATPVAVAAAVVPNIDLALDPGGEITGLITTATATPLDHATVRIQTFGDHSQYSWYAQTTSVATGVYDISGLPAGQYCVTVSDDYYHLWATQSYPTGSTCANGAAPVNVTRGVTTTAGLQLSAGGSIVGKVTVPAGQPVMPVSIYAVGSSRNSANQHPDASGNFTIAHLTPGPYCVVFQANSFSDMVNTIVGGTATSCDNGAGSIIVTNGATTRADVTLQLGGSVSGWVITADNHPVADASVIVLAPGASSTQDTPELGQLDRQRADGSFRVRGIPPGSFCLLFTETVRGIGSATYGNSLTCASGATPVTVSSGQNLGNLRITPPVVGYVSGSVTLPAGRSALNIRVDLYAPGTATPINSGFVSARSSGPYAYSVSAPPGSYCVVLTPDAASGLASRVYPNSPACGRGSQLVSVIATQVTSGIDFTLPVSVYVPLAAPQRLLDTRPGFTTADGTGAGTGELTLGSTRELVVAGRAGVPGTAASVVLNVTAVDATAAGFVTVWPCGTPQPLASNLNFAAGQTVPNSVIAKAGTDGKVCLFSSQAIDAVVDVAGYFPDTVGFTPLPAPQRLLDTRPGFTTADGTGAGTGELTLGSTRELVVAGRAGVPGTAASVVLNVTAVDATAAGFVTVWPCGTPQPLASNLNFAAGQTVPNSVIAKAGTDGKVCLFSSQAIDAVVDVAGYFPDTVGFTPLPAPQRLLDTRPGFTTADGTGAGTGELTLGSTRELVVAGRAGVPGTAASVVLNVTAVDATAAGFVTVWPCGTPQPLASNLNFAAGQTVANSVIAKAGTDGKVCLFSSQAINAVVDVAGYFAF